MIDLGIAAPLAAALAAKGYEKLTAVQMAVLADEAQGRDLLVSAQTGSGKTVAFGIAMADQILAGSDKLLYADVPLALCIAPTRELALQVARELEWLYGPAGAQIATCVGGMDYRSEKRALDRGAHIVVGTPGRLRDHIDRKSLDLSGLRAAVLDEADEMLDLGFRDDLEYILAAASPARRTLMFSATVPKEIAKLAQDFQNDALRIAAQGEAKQHVDIEYRAFSVAVRDREHAIFNALRFYEAQTAIVFCKTRVNVNHLMARMGNRGFKVVALSGELSQQERTNALTALRNGRANVCIATDVAARGIDLPGLELVIHADLPSNSETLLHRSGRTGRAGSKGVSALIVAPSEFKKAQRLLQGAKVVAEWGAAPSAEDVQSRDDLRIFENPVFGMDLAEEMDMATQLIARFGPEQIAAAYVKSWRSGRSAPEVLTETAAPRDAAAPPRERSEFGASVWFELSVGHSGRAEARWLLPKICDAGGISKDGIGAIRVQTEVTYVQIAEGLAGKFGQTLELENGVVMARMAGEPSMDRPERAPRKAPAPRGDRPERVEKAPYEKRDKPAYVPKPSRLVEEARADGYDPIRGNDAPPAEAPQPRKPYAPRAEGAKPYAPRGDKPAYGAKPAYGDKKPYAPRGDKPAYGAKPAYGEKPAYGAKPAYGEKPAYGAKPAYGDKKPYAPRADGERKPYAPRAEGAKPYAPRDSEPKPRWKSDDKAAAPRSAGFKSHGGGDGKPGKATGFKSHSAEGKSFGKPKPAAPRAADTSKRFVPPKKK